jgi:hypothetical protein
MRKRIRRIEAGGRAGWLAAILLAVLVFPAAAPVAADSAGRPDRFPKPVRSTGSTAAPDGLYLTDGNASPGAVFAVQGNGSLAAYYRRPAGALTHFAFSPSGDLFYSDVNGTAIYMAGAPEILVLDAGSYVRDLAFGPDGFLY